MKKYLPSKKFIYTLTSLILAILIIYGVNLLANRKALGIGASETETNKNVTMQEFIVSDSDGDGLKNWEEALWKTDPEKSDTDSDGTSDMEEIKAGRNPVKSNTAKSNQSPNDKMDDETVAARQQTEAEFAQLSTTDKVGRVLLTQYLVNKKVGEEISKVDIANVINNSLSVVSEPVFKQYQLSDLKTIDTENEEMINTYGSKTVGVISGQKITTGLNFNKVISSISSDDTEAETRKKLEQLAPLGKAYENIAMGLLQIEVPAQIAPLHLELINAFAQLSDNLSQIIASANDPIKMVNLLNFYSDSTKRLEAVSNKFSMLK